jgi:membrane-associated phospholipid phosphatase
MRSSCLVVFLGLLLGLAGPVRAEGEAVLPSPPAEPERPLHMGFLLDGSLFVAGAAAIGFSTWISVDRSARWDTQLMPGDDHLKGRYSAGAAKRSDILLAVDVSLPIALFTGQGITAETGKRMAIYLESILVSEALCALVKPIVGRPRPYVYSSDPALAAYRESEGRDAYLSFYSGHSSTAFTASVSSALLFAQSTSDINARAAVWGVELALAAATADLRTRAGKHFYSDVLVGSLTGAAVGLAVPLLHGGPKVRLHKLEWLAIALGPLLGVAVGELMPVRK